MAKHYIENDDELPVSVFPIVGVNFRALAPVPTRKFCIFNCEQIYFWQSTIEGWNDYYLFVSELISDPRKVRPWKTFLDCLRIADSFSSFFEFIPDLSYLLLPDFEFERQIKRNELPESFPIWGRIVTSESEIKFWLPILDLLLRDDDFYFSSLLLLNSFVLHDVCMHCEIEDKAQTDKMHEHYEPLLTEEAKELSYYEPAVVQAMRVIESLVGEPINLQDPRKVAKFEKRWYALNLDPNFSIPRLKAPMLKVFCDFYDRYRNPSAHGYKLKAKRLSREEVIDVQVLSTCFLVEYLKCNKRSLDDSIAHMQVDLSALEGAFKVPKIKKFDKRKS